MTSMNAWLVREWCEPEEMDFGPVELREPGPGEVRIRNHAAALNFFDILLIQGKYQTKPPLPFTPGSEVGGIVEVVGPDVTNLKVGDRVQASVQTGAFAEASIALASKTFRIPDSMSFIEAAAMIIVYQTSWFALTNRTTVREGQWLLVHAAAGGVGMSALQIGKALGARVIATAGSPAKLECCLAQGADFAIDYRSPGWVEQVKEITGGRGADIIYDPVGGDVFEQSLKCIAFEGKLLVIGFASGRIPSAAANRLLLKNASVVGVYWGGYVERNPEYMDEAQQDLFKLYEAGKIKPLVTLSCPLSEAPRALRALAARETTGKVVLTV
jgi:NADPH:quinone reductase